MLRFGKTGQDNADAGVENGFKPCPRHCLATQDIASCVTVGLGWQMILLLGTSYISPDSIGMLSQIGSMCKPGREV